MAKVSFSIVQRLSVENILNTHRGDIEAIETLADLLEKITVPNRGEFIKEIAVPNAPPMVVIDQEAMDAEPVIECDLEKAEARALIKILKEYKGYVPNDLKWVKPLLKQLDN